MRGVGGLVCESDGGGEIEVGAIAGGNAGRITVRIWSHVLITFGRGGLIIG